MEKFLINLKTNEKIVEERKGKAEDCQIQEKTDGSTEKTKKCEKHRYFLNEWK